MEEKAGITIDAGKSALLMLHWQNELVKPGGVLSAQFSGILSASGTVEHMRGALQASRESGVFVAYVNAAHREGYPEVANNPAPLAAGLVKSHSFIKGTWGVEVIEELRPREGEVEIINYSTSAFIYTELDLLLRNRGITTVILTGLATNWVVESTARDAFNRGYCICTLSDCCNSPNKEAHEYSITNTLPMLGVVCDSKAYVEALLLA